MSRGSVISGGSIGASRLVNVWSSPSGSFSTWSLIRQPIPSCPASIAAFTWSRTFHFMYRGVSVVTPIVAGTAPSMTAGWLSHVSVLSRKWPSLTSGVASMLRPSFGESFHS